MNCVAARWDVRSALKEAFSQLRAAGVPSHTLAAELLLMHTLGRGRAWLYAHPEAVIAQEESQRFQALLARRVAGEPTQHLTGKQEFWGLEFEVTPDALIPRPETEHLIEVALDRLGLREIQQGRAQTMRGSDLIVADIGTGSGCIAVALAKELPRAMIFATDISLSALAVARRNAARHGVTDRMQFLACNLLDDVAPSSPACPEPAEDGRRATRHSPALTPLKAAEGPLLLDLVVSNPPYIGRRDMATLPREILEHEPEIALYGGEEGYELYAELVGQAAAHLKPGGVLVLELGHNSLPAVRPLFDDVRWTRVEATNDLAGIPRVLAAERL